MENGRMKAHRTLQQILLACALAAGIAACGSSGPSTGASSSPSSSAPAPSSAAATPSASGPEATIAANWVTFFDAKTPVAKRLALLQDGQALASVIRSQAGGGLAAQATAKVTKVTMVSPTKAKVSYTILISGSPALSGQTGVAVLQNGTWKVGLASFCGLLTLENGGKTSGLPAVCQNAG